MAKLIISGGSKQLQTIMTRFRSLGVTMELVDDQPSEEKKPAVKPRVDKPSGKKNPPKGGKEKGGNVNK